MAIITIVIKTLSTLRYSQVVVVTLGSTYIKEISTPFACAKALAVNAIHFPFVILVIHCGRFCSLVVRFWYPTNIKIFKIKTNPI